jgi:hypothetical protein
LKIVSFPLFYKLPLDNKAMQSRRWREPMGSDVKSSVSDDPTSLEMAQSDGVSEHTD